MEMEEIQNKEEWERFFTRIKDKTFLQSWNWGDFQLKMGNKIWRMGILEKGELTGVALVVKIVAKRGTFLLIQHGPEIIQYKESDKKHILELFLERLKKIGKEENADFIRVAPLLERNKENEKIFNDLGFKESPMHANAYESTWKLDILPAEDELLANMRKTTRYLIKQAQKNPDISVEKSENIGDVEKYQNLNLEIAQRQKFVPFSLSFVKNEFEVFSGNNDAKALLFFGKYKGEIAAASIVIFWQGIGFYHQAASRSAFAKFSIPYLLQWEAIKEAKSRGCRVYDFWGYIDPKTQPKHPWAGPTLFKMGFGGYKEEYIKTQDWPISKKYRLINFFEKIRKFKRGF